MALSVYEMYNKLLPNYVQDYGKTLVVTFGSQCFLEPPVFLLVPPWTSYDPHTRNFSKQYSVVSSRLTIVCSLDLGNYENHFRHSISLKLN